MALTAQASKVLDEWPVDPLALECALSLILKARRLAYRLNPPPA